MRAQRYISATDGKPAAIAYLRTLLVLLCLAPAVAAGPVEDRVQRHIEAAVADGLTPADYHHLVFALNWRTTLEDWTIAERGLDRLAAARQIDPLMADEIRLMRAEIEIDRGRDGTARELFRTMGGLTSWWFRDPVTLEELTDFDRVAVPPTADFEWRSTPGTDPLGSTLGVAIQGGDVVGLHSYTVQALWGIPVSSTLQNRSRSGRSPARCR